MALTRKLLKGMGLTDEQVDTIIEAHSETVNGLKDDVARYKGDAEKLPGVQKELDDLKAKGDDGWKDKHDKLKKEFEQYKDDQTAKETYTAKEKAYRAILKAANISEKRMETVIKAAKADGIIDGIDLDENGGAKDAEKLTENVKSDWSDFIVTTTVQGAQTANPPANSGKTTMTKADIYKKDDKGRYVMSTSERQKALIENKLL